jgi:hypothetical protein
MSLCDCHWAPRAGRQAGSALILVLFACLATAVVLQSLCNVLVIAERALVDESVGRERLGEKDQALALLRQQALTSWQPSGWTAIGAGEGGGEGAGEALGEGVIAELPDSGGWVMSATVRQDPSISRLTVAAWLERGRDGIDLPLAATVAERHSRTRNPVGGDRWRWVTRRRRHRARRRRGSPRFPAPAGAALRRGVHYGHPRRHLAT